MTPTGVDRVEMAYAQGLAARIPDRLSFAAVHPTGIYGRLPNIAVLDFLSATQKRWNEQGYTPLWARRRFAASKLLALWPRKSPPIDHDGNTVYLQSSPHHLTRPNLVRSILRLEHARFACMVHDLIPLEFPEYARPAGAAQHRVRLKTILTHADLIIGNSQATLNSLQPWVEQCKAKPALVAAILGTDRHDMPPSAAHDHGRPYFLCLGTIEPRKNHLLLLNIWRQWATRQDGRTIPKLIIVGRRGWENEQIVDMLERCPPLAECVEEYSCLPDRDVRQWVRGARALLLPSFAEGYGMPVSEALQTGTPVLCSDLPALREAGGDVPEYIDALDGIRWFDALMDYARPDSARRASQMARLRDWRPATWSNHLAIVLGSIERMML